MAMYYCEECAKYKDNDHEMMDDKGMCPDCAEKLSEESGEGNG